MDREALGAGPVDLLHHLARGHVHEDDGHAHELGHGHGAVRGLALADHGVRPSVVLRRGEALVHQPLGQPLDELGVLGVHHADRLLPAHRGQHVEHLAVGELQALVGHVELVGGVALAHERGQLLVQHLRGGVGDDGVKGVVDEAAPLGALAVVGEHLAQRCAVILEGEGDDGRRAAADGRARAGVEVVGDLGPVRQALLQMDVPVDAAGRDGPARGVDLLAPPAEGRGDGLDPPGLDADVAAEDVRRSRDLAVADHQIEFAHDALTLFPCRRRWFGARRDCVSRGRPPAPPAASTAAAASIAGRRWRS